jgi:hypothetical protein
MTVAMARGASNPTGQCARRSSLKPSLDARGGAAIRTPSSRTTPLLAPALNLRIAPLPLLLFLAMCAPCPV